ncbi:MAG TPA: hypothetical protein VMC09_18560 [Anaerolineales bacterium]|nr:hypothetical protein [Anaerolineales bacterium]
MKRIVQVWSTASAIAFGLLVLAGYLFGHNPDGKLSFLGQMQVFILNVAIVLAGFAVLIGIANLSLVHFNKIRRAQKGALYSLLLILAMLGTFIIGVFSYFVPQLTGQYFTAALNAIILPVETSLMAILAVTLVYASIRLLRRRFSLLSVLFLAAALIVLLGTAPLPFLGNISLDGVSILGSARLFLSNVMATAGARGILIGVALGTLTVGLRILIGSDRPYGGGK